MLRRPLSSVLFLVPLTLVALTKVESLEINYDQLTSYVDMSNGLAAGYFPLGEVIAPGSGALDYEDVKLQHCEGHCRSNDDCAGKNSICIKYSNKGSDFSPSLNKYGCATITPPDSSPYAAYCVDKDKRPKEPWVSSAPTPSPTISFSPTATRKPTNKPTDWINLYPENEVPKDKPTGYFDYSGPDEMISRNDKDDDDDDHEFGPNRWHKIDGEDTHNREYWNEFSDYIEPDLEENMCDNNGDSARQSPIDLRFDWATSQCFEYHQIRSKGGAWGIQNPVVEKKILPSKLRIEYPRVYNGEFKKFGMKKLEVTENDQVLGPSADMPKAWGHQLPVLHVDIKIPSEHYMEGKQYAAEYQINMIQNRENKKRGAPIVSVLFDIHPEEEDHTKIQQMLDEFQKVYDADMAECEDRRRSERRLGAWADESLDTGYTGAEDLSTWLDEPEEEEEKFQAKLGNLRRQAQEMNPLYRNWNPFHYSILTTDWFYGYEGSLTEPPCTEFVEWRVMNKPALISTKQLNQMKNVLFNHVNGKCERTSVHSSAHGVARPLQKYNGRDVYQCMCRDFISDKDRDWYGANRCDYKDRDQFGFDKDVYTKEWYKNTHPYPTMEDYFGDKGCPHWAADRCKEINK